MRRFHTAPWLSRLLLSAIAAGAAFDAAAQTIDGFNPLPNGSAIGVAVQADGKIIIASQIQTVGATGVVDIARLERDGSLDPDFIGLSAVNGEIKAVAVQADGKIAIGGTFDTINSTPHHHLARLNSNGTLDTSFADPELDGTVWSIAVQPDGKILAAGSFALSGSTSRGRLARFTNTGGLDTTFVDPQICGSEVRGLALQANGSVVVSGYFYHIGNCSGNPLYSEFLARFTSTGSFDSTFPTDTPPGPIGGGIAIGPDGSIYVPGGYATSDSIDIRLVSKLSSSGALITSYDNLHNDGAANTLALQSDGKLLVGGVFQSIDAQARHGLLRLNADGSLDTGFSDLNFSLDATHPNGSVFALASQTDGSTVVTGNFALVNGQSRQYAARVVSADVAISKLSGQASGNNIIVTWTRNGAGPELAQPPILMHSSNGTTYTSAGTMNRISTGWQFTAPYNVAGTPFYLRADAYTSSGAGNGSAGRISSPVYVSDRIFANGFE